MNLLSKRAVVAHMLQLGDVMLHLCPRIEGVVAPERFMHMEVLVLHVGLNMPVPISDLALDDDAIRATLSFDREPFHCVIPWNALMGASIEPDVAVIWDLVNRKPEPKLAKRPSHLKVVR